MTNAVQVESQPLNRGRPTKFTPERIQQICNLVEQGKSRDEIAEIIGVTTGTLQVTCSKLGISLRRPRFDIGTSLLPRRQPQYQKNAPPTRSGLLEGSGPEIRERTWARRRGNASRRSAGRSTACRRLARETERWGGSCVRHPNGVQGSRTINWPTSGRGNDQPTRHGGRDQRYAYRRACCRAHS